MEPWPPDPRPEEQLLVISPELALVDPELAAAARAALPDRPLSTSAVVRAAPLEPPERSKARLAAPPRQAARPRRSRVRRPIMLCVFAAALLLGVAHARDPVQGVMAGGRLPGSAAASQPGVEAAAAVEARTPPKVLIWPQVAGAAAYRVELFRGGVRIYGGTTRETRLELPFSWRYEGLRRELLPGAYRWIVYPLLPQGTALAQGDAVVRSEWVIPRSTRGAIPLDG